MEEEKKVVTCIAKPVGANADFAVSSSIKGNSYGSKGDPRMSQKVGAREADPSITSLEALILKVFEGF